MDVVKFDVNGMNRTDYMCNGCQPTDWQKKPWSFNAVQWVSLVVENFQVFPDSLAIHKTFVPQKIQPKLPELVPDADIRGGGTFT